jgi:hypothetical protein
LSSSFERPRAPSSASSAGEIVGEVFKSEKIGGISGACCSEAILDS